MLFQHRSRNTAPLQEVLSSAHTVNKNTLRSTSYRAKARDKVNARRRARYAAAPDAVLAQNKAYRAANREKVNAQRRRATYGTDGAELWEKQRGACAICGVDLASLPPRHRHIDHCHETGVVRGLLCQFCNTALGLFQDDPARLRAAAAYVQQFEVFK